MASVAGRKGLRRVVAVVVPLAGAALIASIFAASPAAAATFTVTRTDDPAPNGCAIDGCSLREAIIVANGAGGTNNVELPAGTYDLSITGTGEDASATGDLDITQNVNIIGGGATTTTVDANDVDRVIDVLAGVVSISDLTIRDGSIPSPSHGGGIFNVATVHLTDMMVTDNESDVGGITNYTGSTMTMTDSTVSDNRSSDNAGGLYNVGTLTITGSTISGNTANTGGTQRGGGIYNDGPLTITNSTISGNSSAVGGGIYAGAGSITMLNSTLTENIASVGTGLYRNGGSISSENSIIANNSGTECSSPISGSGHNLDSDSSCFVGPNAVHQDPPLLGPLSFNGGPTKTHALRPGSLAIDAGTNPGCPSGDQRGVARPFDGNGDASATCDIGAYEVAPTTFTPTRTDDPAPNGCSPTDCSLREALIAANQDSASDTIDVPAGTYNLTVAGPGEDLSATGDLDLTRSASLEGAGATTTTIDAGGAGSLGDRVLSVFGGVTANISGVKIKDGDPSSAGGGVANSGTVHLTDSIVSGNSASSGGALFNTGTATLTGATVSGNSAPGQGGGILNNNGASLTLTDSTVHGNMGGFSGGIFNENVATTTITDTTVSGNTTDFQGGAVYNDGGASLTITSSAITGNEATSAGGGIYNTGATASLTNSTISGNMTDGAGGGFWTQNGGTLVGSTITNNTAASGGRGLHQNSGPQPTVRNSIIAKQAASGADCNATVDSTGPNLDFDSTCFNEAGDLHADPLLGSLADNGGPTLTHSLAATSPAIQAGGPGCPPPATDQRGVTRPQGASCDIGAYEAPNDAPAAINDGYSTDEEMLLTVAVADGVLDNDTDAQGDPLTTVEVDGPDHESTFTLNADGSFSYTPELNFTGDDTFTYKTNDGADDSNVATVTITVDPINDEPQAGNDAYSTDEDTPLSVPAPTGVLDNDTDLDDDPLTVSLDEGPDHAASFTLNPNGSFTYTPVADYNGADSFTYHATDGDLDSDTATVTITVDPVSDTPTLTVAPGRCLSDAKAVGTLLVTVADIDNAVADLVVTATSSKQSLVPNDNLVVTGTGADRTVEMTAVVGRSGTVVITFTVSDSTSDESVVRTVYVGSGQSDVLGAANAHAVFGMGGNDRLFSGSANDLLCGGKGNDTLKSASGRDVLMGGRGNDLLVAGNGNDTMFGQAGRDRLTGGSGADLFDGGPGPDSATDFKPGQGDSGIV